MKFENFLNYLNKKIPINESAYFMDLVKVFRRKKLFVPPSGTMKMRTMAEED